MVHQKNLKNRLLEHNSDLKNNKHVNNFLQKVYNKHGLDVEIIEYCDSDIRIEREKYWIDTLETDMNLKDPISSELSEESKQKLSEYVKKGYSEGRYKKKFDLNEIECYDIFGNFLKTFKDKQDAAKELNCSVKTIESAASSYKDGRNYMGYRLRYSDSKVPIQKFNINPNYIGKYFDFYYIDKDNNERLAFTSVKDVWSFFGNNVISGNTEFIIKAKLKKLRESEESYEEKESAS